MRPNLTNPHTLTTVRPTLANPPPGGVQPALTNPLNLVGGVSANPFILRGSAPLTNPHPDDVRPARPILTLAMCGPTGESTPCRGAARPDQPAHPGGVLINPFTLTGCGSTDQSTQPGGVCPVSANPFILRVRPTLVMIITLAQLGQSPQRIILRTRPW
ncbi:MAG TPA: hypothetical protein VIY29_11980 [Ktedonobacteraceae bacterium]